MTKDEMIDALAEVLLLIEAADFPSDELAEWHQRIVRILPPKEEDDRA